MHLEFLLEEPSTEAALLNLLPKMLAETITFRLHNFHDKLNLLKQLPNRLQGYRNWLPADSRIVVLVDEDRAPCTPLKQQMEECARQAGLLTKSAALANASFQVLNRIAVEELEAWFFGDITALNRAYPRVPTSLGEKEKYRDPDAIVGGTWEALEKVLQTYGYYAAGLPKIEAARNITQHMEPARNRSKSFQHFHTGLQALLG
jgi:hypothetical protein